MTAQRVGVVHHFFAHYRRAIVEELSFCERYTYAFYGDTHDFRLSGIPAALLPHSVRFRRLRCFRLPVGLMWQRGLVWHAATTSEDAVIFLGDIHYVATWVAAIILRCRRRKVLFWTHGWRERESGLKRLARLAFYRLANSLLLYGDHARSIGRALGFPVNRMHVINNSLPVPLTFPSSERSRTHQQWIVIGRLTRERHIDRLLHGMAALARTGKRPHLTVVGDGPELHRLTTLATRHDISVTFTGAIYNTDVVGRLLAESDISVYPAAAGLGVIEALSAGCPVAAHSDRVLHGPEFEAICPGVNGVVAPDDGGSALATAAWTFVQDSNRTAVAISCHAAVTAGWTANSQHHAIDRGVDTVFAGDAANEA